MPLQQLAHHESFEKQSSICLLEDVLKQVPLCITEFMKNNCPCKEVITFFLSTLLNFILKKEFRFLQNFQLLSECIVNPMTSVYYRLHFEKCNHMFSQSKGFLLPGIIFSISLDIHPRHQESPYLYCPIPLVNTSNTDKMENRN